MVVQEWIHQLDATVTAVSRVAAFDCGFLVVVSFHGSAVLLLLSAGAVALAALTA